MTEEEARTEAILDIIYDSSDGELVKGFMVYQGAAFLRELDHLQLYGVILELLHEMDVEQVKNVVKRMSDQADMDDDELANTVAAEYARRCVDRYRSTFQ